MYPGLALAVVVARELLSDPHRLLELRTLLFD